MLIGRVSACIPVGGLVTEVVDGVNSGDAALSFGCGTSLRQEGLKLLLAVVGCRHTTDAAAAVTEQTVKGGLSIPLCWCCASLTAHNIFSMCSVIQPCPRGKTNRGGEMEKE